MDRNNTIKTLHNIARTLAEEFGFNKCNNEEFYEGIWTGMKGMLEKDYGDLSGYKLYKGDEPNDDDGYIEFRYRFRSPCLAVHGRDGDGNQTMAEIQLSDSRPVGGKYDLSLPIGQRFENTDDYRINEIMCWEAKSLKLLNRMISMWDAAVLEGGIK